MESGMIMITIALITVCALPFILMNLSAKKKEKQIKKDFEMAVASHNGVLTDYEIHDNFALGIDGNSRHIYYYKKAKNNETLISVNLQQVKSCEVRKETSSVTGNGAAYEIVQHLFLKFTPLGNGTTQEFELFNYDESTQLNGEIALAAQWKQKVDVLLSEKSNSSMNSGSQTSAMAFA